MNDSTDIITSPDPEDLLAPSAGSSPEAAFRSADEITFRGQKLQPFSFLRQTAAIELGLKYWRLGPGDLYTISAGPGEESVQMYDGFVFDVAIILWVCSQIDSEVRRARRKARDYEARIDRFADENGIAVGGPHFAEASAVFTEIVQAVNASRGEPDLGPSGGRSDAPKT